VRALARTAPPSLAASPHLVGVIVVVVGAALFGMLGPLSRTAYDLGIEPLSFVAWRAAIGGLALGLVAGLAILRGRAFVSLATLDRRGRAAYIVAIGTGVGLNLAIFAAFQRIDVGLALLCFYFYPAMTAAVEIALGRERLDRFRAIALVMASAGMVALLAGAFGGGVLIDPLGIALALTAAVCQTIFIVVSRDSYSSIPTDQAMTGLLVGSALAAVPIALVVEGAASLALPLSTPELLAVVLVAGTVGAALPSLLFLAGIRLVGGTTAGILMLVEPLVGVTLAAMLLGERLQPIQILGGLGILGAAVLVQRAVARDRGPRAGGEHGLLREPA
jgi:drug/metabolite transporter (DMT)-like permease